MNDEKRAATPSVEDRLSRLVDSADELCAGDEHRREPLVERGEDRGLARATAERAYDLAIEERLPPAYGIAVAIAGVSVQPMDSPAPDVRVSEPKEPGWVDTPPEGRDADYERRMRQTFRRLRSFVADASTPREAFAALAREPDLESFDY